MDHSLPEPSMRSSLPAVRWPSYLLPMCLIFVGIVAFFSYLQLFNQTHHIQTVPLSLNKFSFPHFSASSEQKANSTAEEIPAWKTVIIKQGDSLSKIFNALGINRKTLTSIQSLGEVKNALRGMRPKQKLQVLINTEHQLEQLIYPLSITRSLAVVKHGQSYVSKIIEHPVELRQRYASGVIRDSLFLDGERAGLPQANIVELANMFNWDIDFAKDLQAGDQFDVIFEESYREGQRIGNGHIVAARFINNRQKYEAIRYTDAQGDTSYYTPAGNSMRKAFLRTPVHFTRISSLFTTGRMHPILHHLRAHKGVDYAAPMGTPVRSTGNGKIVFRGQKSGYGNVVIIQHNGVYQTLYGHLQRFAHALSRGERVKQGQVIGYVGMTGLATGPHLHYEFHVNGQHRDPLKVKLTYADPIPAKYRSDFRRKAKQLLAKLDRLHLAGAESGLVNSTVDIAAAHTQKSSTEV